MLASHVETLACPLCGNGLSVEYGEGRRLEDAVLRCSERHRHVVKKGVARFVTAEPYSTGIRRASRMQLDSATHSRFWYETFKAATGLRPEELAGKKVLDLGCGTGRFLEWVSKYAAHVVAFEPTGAIDVCHDNLGELPNVTFVQGEFEKAYLLPRQFDFVYSLGALHHAASTENAFKTAVRYVKPQGQIAIWLAPEGGLLPSALELWRKLTTHLSPWLVEVLLDYYLPAALRVRRLEPRLAALPKRVLPLQAVPDHLTDDGDRAEFLRAGIFQAFTAPHMGLHAKEDLLQWCSQAGLDVIAHGLIPNSVRGKKRHFLIEQNGFPVADEKFGNGTIRTGA